MPLLLSDGVAQLDHTPGMLLGVEQDADWAPHEATLPEEWGLLLFSDGLVEARLAPGSRQRLGIEGLRRAVDELWRRRATSPSDLRGLVDGVQQGQEGVLEDDVTLLLLSHDVAGARSDAV
jgi:serine phosphatase RsbU (regulator of sigma subunit)